MFASSLPSLAAASAQIEGAVDEGGLDAVWALMALTLPFTYHMSSVDAVSLLIAAWSGAVLGGVLWLAVRAPVTVRSLTMRDTGSKHSDRCDLLRRRRSMSGGRSSGDL